MQDIAIDFEKDFSKEFYEEASTTRTLKNIKKALVYSLKKKYNISDNAIAEEILKIHGLHTSNFDFIKNVENIINAKLNDVSIDDNSNKNEKVIAGILQEIKIAVDKAVGYDYLYRVCKEMYGKAEAKRLMGSLYDFSLGINDSAKILSGYCFAIDASKIVLEGRNFGVLPSSPAKRISSYVSALCETVHNLANHVAGAVAIGTLFLDVGYLCLYKEKNTFDSLKKDKNVRKLIENEFQQLVHSLNSLSRNSSETPFSNISIFDRPKLKAILDANNMGWYFPYEEKLYTEMFGSECNKENYMDFLCEYIMEIQFIFLDFYDNGDPLNGGRQYRFPVCFPENESIIINDNLTTFGDVFKGYKKGWTKVENLQTKYKGKNVKINNVFVGESSSFVEILGYGTGKKIRVTPEHKFLLESGDFVCAKDLKLKDRILYDKSVGDFSERTAIDLSSFFKEEDLWILGYRFKAINPIREKSTNWSRNIHENNNSELPKLKSFGFLIHRQLLRIPKSYIISKGLKSLRPVGTKLKKFYERKVSISQHPTFKKFQRTNFIISILKKLNYFVKTFFCALYPKAKAKGFTAQFYKKSHPFSYYSIRDYAFIFPEVDYIKYRNSKQKGAIRKTVPNDKDFGFYLGLFCAEGHTSNGEIGFSFNKKEKDLISFVKDYTNFLVKDVVILERKIEGEGYQLCFNSIILESLFFTFLKKGSKNLEINLELISKYFSYDAVVGFILGYIAGDGYIDKYTVCTTTASLKLAETFQNMLLSVGVASCIKEQMNNRGFGGKNAIAFEVDICKKDIFPIISENVSFHFDKFSKLKGEYLNKFNSRTAYIVRGVEFLNYNKPLPVYNLEVDNSQHLFTLPSGVITSNCTLNPSKEFDEKNNQWKVSDEKFLKDICKYEIFRYNIYSSLGMKVASCCFSRDTKFITTKGSKSFEDFNHGDSVEVYNMNGMKVSAKVYNYGKQEIQKVVLNNNLNEEKTIFCTLNHTWILKDGTKTNELKIGDAIVAHANIVSSYSWKVKSIEKLNVFEDVWCLEVEDETHTFLLEGFVVTGNCRLVNDADMLSLGSQVNSFGGSAISLGSHRVVTINFNRIVLQSENEEQFYKLLDIKIDETAKILKAHKELISILEKKGLQPFITNNWLILNKMFSTFGIMGIYEAVVKMSDKVSKSFDDLMDEILTYLNNKVKEVSKQYGIYGNIEAIPGESFAVRLAKTDRLIFGQDKVSEVLYSNQFIPLWEDASVYERMEKDGRFQGKMTGGSICHFTLGEKITGKQAEKLIRYAISVGNEHFALNGIYSECEDKHNSFGKFEKCPVCGKQIIEYYTRVIGYFSPVSAWNKERREWEFPKRVVKAID